MASNSFGDIFRIVTWGESHGKAIGVVIDGCPAGIELTADDINCELKLRAPGTNQYTSPRKEPDLAEIYSGIFDNKTTGAPISIIIKNQDQDSSKYEPIKNLLRPGHANFTYLEKYGIFDYRGGGRASARETACRVAAGAVAQKILDKFDINIKSYIKNIEDLYQKITELKKTGDSIGAIIDCKIENLPIGLGDPVYQKLEAKLANAMLSIPATKGFEVGEGFAAAKMLGSEHNDLFIADKKTNTNHAGGTLGGISTGMPLEFRVAFKPTSSIKKTQQTIDLNGKDTNFTLPAGSRHDPCVAIRAIPVVTAMARLVIVDSLLMNKVIKI